MDKTDERILDLLKGNARMTYQELGDALGMSRVAAQKRVKRRLNTVDDLVGAMTEGKSLKTLRNCGAKSVEEIMEHLFLWQLREITPERRIKYLAKVFEMNIGASLLL